jgi:hypothetical protein
MENPIVMCYPFFGSDWAHYLVVSTVLAQNSPPVDPMTGSVSYPIDLIDSSLNCHSIVPDNGSTEEFDYAFHYLISGLVGEIS